MIEPIKTNTPIPITPLIVGLILTTLIIAVMAKRDLLGDMVRQRDVALGAF